MENQEKTDGEQSQAPLSVAFVHGFLDDYGLDPYEFRLYAHIVRRTGGKSKGVCFASISTIAKVCKVSSRKTQQVIKILMSANFITQHKRPGRTDEYRVTPASEWAAYQDLVEIRKQLKKEPSSNNIDSEVIENIFDKIPFE